MENQVYLYLLTKVVQIYQNLACRFPCMICPHGLFIVRLHNQQYLLYILYIHWWLDSNLAINCSIHTGRKFLKKHSFKLGHNFSSLCLFNVFLKLYNVSKWAPVQHIACIQHVTINNTSTARAALAGQAWSKFNFGVSLQYLSYWEAIFIVNCNMSERTRTCSILWI